MGGLSRTTRAEASRVDDPDAAYARALACGAASLEAPLDTPYGDRRAMVRDPLGNVWQLARVSTPEGDDPRGRR